MTVRGVVANLSPSIMRARAAKGTLVQLGLPEVPVSAGFGLCHVTELEYESPARRCGSPERAQIPYMSAASDVETDSVGLMTRLLTECVEDQSMVLVLNSGLRDALELVRRDADLFCKKVRHVAIMGGVVTDVEEAHGFSEHCATRVRVLGGYMMPNNAANHLFDTDFYLLGGGGDGNRTGKDAWELYALLQKLRVPMIITTRELAYATQMPFSFYDELERTDHVVGKCLAARQRPSIRNLWRQACASPENKELRGSLPIDRNRAWFVRVFCGGVDPAGENGEEEEEEEEPDIWDHVTLFNLYDPANLCAAVPALEKLFFSPTVVAGIHKVIGVSDADPGIMVADRANYVAFVRETELFALSPEEEQEKRASALWRAK